MTKFFNIDIENIITDYDLSYRNINDHFMSQTTQLNNDLLKMYTQKMEESHKISNQLSDIKNQITEDRGKLTLILENVESDQQAIQTENNHLESILNESRLLEVEEDELKNELRQNEEELTQVSKEKKAIIKKHKREVKAFKSGVEMYKKFLQMDLSIEYPENTAIINITLKNLHSNSIYNIVLEENDQIFNLININPNSPSIMEASALYNQNKDIQGLLAFLSNVKE